MNTTDTLSAHSESASRRPSVKNSPLSIGRTITQGSGRVNPDRKIFHIAGESKSKVAISQEKISEKSIKGTAAKHALEAPPTLDFSARAEVRTTQSLEFQVSSFESTWRRRQAFKEDARLPQEVRDQIKELKENRTIRNRFEKFFGFLPEIRELVKRFGIPPAYAEIVMGQLILGEEARGNGAREIAAQEFNLWRSRAGLPSIEKVKNSHEKVAFLYLEEAAFKMGLLAAAPETLASYGSNAYAGVVAPEIYQPFVNEIRSKLNPNQLIEGERLLEVLNQIALLKPGRLVIFKGPKDAHLPAALIGRLLRDPHIPIEIRTMTRADLDRANASSPGLAAEIESLRRKVESLASAA